MGRALALCCCLAGLAAGVAGAHASNTLSRPGVPLVTVHPSGPEAARGIGPVRLNETLVQVEQALGPGALVHIGTQEGFGASEQFKEAVYRYRSGSIVIEVSYGEGAGQPGVANVVSSISTASPSAVLFGHRLGTGLGFFESLLRAHHWHIFRCHHEVFTTLLPGGPGTGISWKRGRLHEVVIDGGGSWGQQCER
jgi:hypothetical protein